MAKTSLMKFMKETKQEALKVTWPSRKETMTTTAIVFIMMFIMAVFLFFTDVVISTGVKFILGLGD